MFKYICGLQKHMMPSFSSGDLAGILECLGIFSYNHQLVTNFVFQVFGAEQLVHGGFCRAFGNKAESAETQPNSVLKSKL